MKRTLFAACATGMICFWAWGCSDNGGGGRSTDSEPAVTDSGSWSDSGSGIDTGTDSQVDTGSDTGSALPLSCADAGVACGVIELAGGTFTDCGSCTAPQTCGALEPGQCGCEPLTCAFAGADCGTIDDGCGHTLECGTCVGLATCGGSFAPNVCAAPVCNDYCWCSVTPYPQADDLSLIYYDGIDDSLWVGGAEGQLLVHRNGGWELFSTYTRVPSDLYAMVLFGPEDGWIVGENGAILKYEGTRFHCSYIDKEEKTVNWSPVKYDLFDLWAAASTSIWVAGAQGVLHWDGTAWTEERSSAGELYAVSGATEDDLWFGGTRNNAPFLLHKKGALFSVADVSLPDLKGAIRDLCTDYMGVQYAVGEQTDGSGVEIGGFVLRQTSEESWERLDAQNIEAGLLSCAFDERGVLWAVGRRGVVATFDGTRTTSSLSLWGTADLRVIAQGKNNLVVAGETGMLAVESSGFLFPNVARSPVTAGQADATSVALSRDAQFSVGQGFALLWRGTGFGYAPVPANLTGLLSFGPSTVYAAGNDGSDAVILRYDGKGWTEVGRAEDEVASGLDGTSTTDIRARLAGNRVLHFDGKSAAIRAADELPAVPDKAQVATAWTITERGFERDVEGQTELMRAFPVDGLTQMPHRAVGSPSGQMWSVGKDGAIWFDGTLFQRIAADVAMSDVAIDQDGAVWITGAATTSAGPLWRFEAGGLVDAGFDAESELNAVAVAQDGTLFVAGEAIYQLEGDEWVEVLPGNGTPVLDIGAVSATDIWAGRGFDLLHLESGEWVTRPTTDLQDIEPLSDDHRVVVHTIFPISSDEVLIAGDTNDKGCFVMIGYVDGVFSSRPMCSLYGEATLNDVWAMSAEDAFVTVGQVGYVYHYDHTVRMFDTVDAVTADPLGALWGMSDGCKWAFGEDGVIMRGVPVTDPACQ